MNSESEPRQLRGWKEIAAYLRSSERSVKRWERSRGLPIHRVPGAARDAVFARIDDLDQWQTAGRQASAPAVESVDPNLSDGDVAVVGPAPSPPLVSTRLRRRRLVLTALGLAATGAVIVAGYAVSRWAGSSATTAPGAQGPVLAPEPGRHPTTAPAIFLRVTGQSTQPVVVGVADGGTGSVELPGGQRVDLQPRRLPGGLLVEITSREPPLDSARDTRPRTITLLLELRRRVRVPTPPAFDIEWIESPGGGAAGGPPVVSR